MSWLRKNDHQTEHRYTEERLSAYLDGELPAKERAAVDRHLATCRACRLNLETLRQTVRWTRGLTPVPLPRVFTIPVPAQPVRTVRPAFATPLLRAATVAVALLLFVAVAGDLALTGLAPQQAAQPVAFLTVAPVASEADQAGEGPAATMAPSAPGSPAAESQPVEPPLAAQESAPPAGTPADTMMKTEAPEEQALSVMTETRPERGMTPALGMGGASTVSETAVVEAASEPAALSAIASAEPTATATLTATASMPQLAGIMQVTITLAFTPAATLTPTPTLTPTQMIELFRVDPTPTRRPPKPTLPPTSLPTVAVPTEPPAVAATDTLAPTAPAEARQAAEQEALTVEQTVVVEQQEAVTAEPTAVAAAPAQPAPVPGPNVDAQAGQDEQGEPQQGLPEAIRPWLRWAELALAALLVLLVIATLYGAARRRRQL